MKASGLRPDAAEPGPDRAEMVVHAQGKATDAPHYLRPLMAMKSDRAPAEDRTSIAHDSAISDR